MKLLFAILLIFNHVAAQLGARDLSDIPRWCGKPYEAGSPNVELRGILSEPKPSQELKLHLKVQPRHSIYVSSEDTGEFIVDAVLSHIHGAPWSNSTPVPSGLNETQHFSDLFLDIRIENTNQLLASEKIRVNTTGNIVKFALNALEPQLTPYKVVIYGAPSASYSNQSFSAAGELLYLPTKRTGSMVKIDNLNGGLLVANNFTGYAFHKFLPFGFYTGCSNYLDYSIANVSAYKDLGFNAINPGCSFESADMSYLFDWLDEVNLWYQYNMRWSYSNLTSVREQIPHVKDRSNLLSWYTADEPDGNVEPINSTRSAYELLKREDPYHPISLVLNCENYYFQEYSSGADFIMEDAYPIGISPNYSRKYDTVCNTTYGCCGCDNCIGELEDVSNRLDTFETYQNWIGGFKKPLWAVLQSFSGEKYWSRDPTPQETWAMMILSWNHKAKAIISWDFPTSAAQQDSYSRMAQVATGPPVSDFLLGSQPVSLKIASKPLIDVAYWVSGDQIMLGLANLDYMRHESSLSIRLPKNVSRIVNQPWGDVKWTLGNNTLYIQGLEELASSLVVLQ